VVAFSRGALACSSDRRVPRERSDEAVLLKASSWGRASVHAAVEERQLGGKLRRGSASLQVCVGVDLRVRTRSSDPPSRASESLGHAHLWPAARSGPGALRSGIEAKDLAAAKEDRSDQPGRAQWGIRLPASGRRGKKHWLRIRACVGEPLGISQVA